MPGTYEDGRKYLLNRGMSLGCTLMKRSFLGASVIGGLETGAFGGAALDGGLETGAFGGAAFGGGLDTGT